MVAARQDASPRRAAVALTAGPARWLRGAVVGILATGVAALGHALEGAAPAPAATTGLAALAVVCCIAMSRVEWSIVPLLGVLAAAQVGFHVALGGAVPTHLGGTPVAAHAAAALVTALLLRRGEDAVWRFADLMARPLRATRGRALPTITCADVVRWASIDPSGPSANHPLDVAPRRGPPSLSVA